jgi:hypothetical protein
MWTSNVSPRRPEIKINSTGRRAAIAGELSEGLWWTSSEAAVLVTVTVTVAAVDPFSVIELGDTPHVDCDGAPLQVKVTVWLKPPPGAAVTL